MMKDNLALVVKDEADSLSIVKRVVSACEEVKGKEISVLDVHSLSDFADFFVIVSGRSDRQVQGITNRVIEELIKSGARPLSVEGYEDGQWVLVDCGDVVVHVFYEENRKFYDLESLWMRAKRVSVTRDFA
jgi:ribosome-associated protein